MIRRKKRFANRQVVSFTSEAALPTMPKRGSQDGGRGGTRHEPGADTGPRSYEASYSVSTGYTSERAIVLP